MHVGSMELLVGLVMLVGLVLILSVALLAVTRPGQHPRGQTDRAREVLADRYARGEIDLDEYRERLGTPREEVTHR